MKIFKIDLMTVLFIVVLIGVIATMTSQANDHAIPGSAIASATSSDFSAPGFNTPSYHTTSTQRISKYR